MANKKPGTGNTNLCVQYIHCCSTVSENSAEFIRKMTIKHFEKLSNNYIELLEKGIDFNVIIKVGKSTNIKESKAHSAILKCRSFYFQNKLKDSLKDVNSIMKIDLESHISIQQFEIIIKYIYEGSVSLENFDNQFIFDLILVTDEFLLEDRRTTKMVQQHFSKTSKHYF
ncbi:hypothetical protein C2G38_1709063 [Gigaspora rosea]|uniref:BTB domain-containing protein n=1 Tax=Gigaspora rosea TaxID=44941 RepID=A0A397UY87_9GLOM|nr:hypothetical protein C2G38_1709063 [Gigaspora rosea]